MKVLIVDTDGCGLAFAWRCANAGHEVRLFFKESPTNNPTTGRGFKGVRIVQNWIESVMWADLVFVTSNSDYMARMQALRSRGAKYFGPSVASADLEIKRAEGMKFLQKHGIDVPPYKTFASLKDAEKHVWKTERRFVFKTMGDNEDKSLSYCAKSPADMISRLERWQKLGMNPKGEVMLQEFIPGMEMGISRWMGAAGYIGLPGVSWEHKKLMPGNFGPNTGEMGTAMCYVEKDRMYDEIMAPLEKDLVAMGHLGDVSVNCIIDEKGKAWPLEFTCRPGWPAFNMMLNQHKGDPCQWMADAVAGKDSLSCTTEMGICVVLAQPKFPYKDSNREETEGLPIYGVHKGNSKHIQPQSVRIESMPDMEGDKVVDRDMWVTTGDYIAVVTGTGKTVKVAKERAYATVDEISVPDMIVRNDIGDRLKEWLPKLHKMGYATGVKFE